MSSSFAAADPIRSVDGPWSLTRVTGDSESLDSAFNLDKGLPSLWLGTL